MKTTSYLLSLAGICLSAADIVREEVVYYDGEQELDGVLFYDSDAKGARPGVYVIHNWSGAPEEHWAERLAGEGYVALAGSVYTPEEIQQTSQPMPASMGARMQTTSKYYDDVPMFRQRLDAGVNYLQALDMVRSDSIGSVGFCFGGKGALELAREGTEGVKAAVSIHGSFETTMPAPQLVEGSARPDVRVLVLHGANDNNVIDAMNWGQMAYNSENLPNFETEMQDAGILYELTKFSEVVHSFTDPSAGDNPASGSAYSEYATHRSWTAVRDFFHLTLEPEKEVLCGDTYDCSVEAECNCAEETGMRRRLLFGGNGNEPDACMCDNHIWK